MVGLRGPLGVYLFNWFGPLGPLGALCFRACAGASVALVSCAGSVVVIAVSSAVNAVATAVSSAEGADVTPRRLSAIVAYFVVGVIAG